VNALAVDRLQDVIGGALVIDAEDDVMVALLRAEDDVIVLLNAVEDTACEVLLDPRPDKIIEPTSVDDVDAGAEVTLLLDADALMPTPTVLADAEALAPALAVPDADAGRVQAPPSCRFVLPLQVCPARASHWSSPIFVPCIQTCQTAF
jgi:hypothetical protein